MAKAMLYRKDKVTAEVTCYSDSAEAIKQYQQDFGVKTPAIAGRDLLQLMVDPGVFFIQNVRVIWYDSSILLAGKV